MNDVVIAMQALANTMQALSKLDHYSGSLCTAVDQAVAASIPVFPPREFSSLMWVFVNFRHAPSTAFWGALSTHLIATGGLGPPSPAAENFEGPHGGSETGSEETHVSPSQSWKRKAQVWNATHWATLIWSAGKLAWKPSEELWATLEAAVSRHMDEFKPQELCNMLW